MITLFKGNNMQCYRYLRNFRSSMTSRILLWGWFPPNRTGWPFLSWFLAMTRGDTEKWSFATQMGCTLITSNFSGLRFFWENLNREVLFFMVTMVSGEDFPLPIQCSKSWDHGDLEIRHFKKPPTCEVPIPTRDKPSRLLSIRNLINLIWSPKTTS